ncbi:S1C family serine protease [Deinococcus yavapaiensis]|nr:trypsin-like peptidase domain-containing protein [Deinococcus yavapaiensis]
MKPGLTVLAVLVALGLGATIFRDSIPLGNAQSPSTTQNQERAAPINEDRARLENERNTVDIVKRFEPGLVYIGTTSVAVTQDPLSQYFGGAPRQQVQQGAGSGFFVNDKGDILTNYHVVGEASQIEIRLLNGQRTYPARVIGTAAAYDLALIRPQNVPSNLVKPIPLGDSSQVQVGQKAIAMGAPFNFDFTVTEGIVSAVNRLVPVGVPTSEDPTAVPQRVIQTDAAINPGNSGGPLLDSSGRVIGINSQIISPSGAVTGQGQFAGIGFAIPINVAKRLLPRLQAGETIRRPLIGVQAAIVVQDPQTGEVDAANLSDLSSALRRQYNLPSSGFLVGQVTPGSPAAKAGLRGGTRVVNPARNVQMRLGGDVIVSVDGTLINAQEDLQSALIARNPGDKVRLEIKRGGQNQTITVTLTQESQRRQ